MSTQQIRYSPVDQTLRIGKVVAPLKLSGKTLTLLILVDRSSMDLFADTGQVNHLDDIPRACTRS